MKISVLFTEGARQVIMTPETEYEQKALGFIAPDNVLRVVARRGDFGVGDAHVNYQIAKCQGGWYRPFPKEHSVMFVIEDDSRPLPEAG